MFTRKFFVLVALVLKRSRPQEDIEAKKQYIKTVNNFADQFLIENSAFDRARFMTACGCDAVYCRIN